MHIDPFSYFRVDNDLHKLFAEVLGRNTGFSAGMGGSMHLASKSKGFLGSVPIVTGTVPLALGAGLASNYKNLEILQFLIWAMEQLKKVYFMSH